MENIKLEEILFAENGLEEKLESMTEQERESLIGQLEEMLSPRQDELSENDLEVVAGGRKVINLKHLLDLLKKGSGGFSGSSGSHRF